MDMLPGIFDNSKLLLATKRTLYKAVVLAVLWILDLGAE